MLFLTVIFLQLVICLPQKKERDTLTKPKLSNSQESSTHAMVALHMYTQSEEQDEDKISENIPPDKYFLTNLNSKPPSIEEEYEWPIRRIAETAGDILLGGLIMAHQREEEQTCGPIMPQGGIQVLECILYTLDQINNDKNFLPGIKIGAYILDDCDKDTYGLKQSVDFIKGTKFCLCLIIIYLQASNNQINIFEM
ncbi:metabotropic glutamate receptor 2 [Nephila pilipes]|uniref:Metabotropic glutamate receptor 2 n=1 Tax=Nephila pilipes TaxID=299642 RepID=A0A8X6NEP2_NEPPI|nr:metabotropic glutamate receptor 2 [Nephila pilipes]